MRPDSNPRSGRATVALRHVGILYKRLGACFLNCFKRLIYLTDVSCRRGNCIVRTHGYVLVAECNVKSVSGPLLLIVLMSSLLPVTSSAVTLFAGSGGSSFFSIDPANGNLSIVDGNVGAGGTSISGITALAFDPNSGVLYGGSGGRQFFSLNPNTGDVSLIDGDVSAGSATIGGITALAFDPNSGRLYGGSGSREFFFINPANGDLTIVDSNVSAGGPPISGIGALAFDPNSGTLYGGSGGRQFFTINPNNGNLSLIDADVSAGGPSINGIGSLAFDPNSGTLYGGSGGGGFFSLNPANGNLSIIDGNVSAGGTSVSGISALSFVAGDADSDGVNDLIDNCPTANSQQLDVDNDGTGDACDTTPFGGAAFPSAALTLTDPIFLGMDAIADGSGSAVFDSSAEAPNLLTYMWSIDGGAAFAGGDTQIFSGLSVGDHVVQLTVTDSYGFSASTTAQVSVVFASEPQSLLLWLAGAGGIFVTRARGRRRRRIGKVEPSAGVLRPGGGSAS
ncbi:MAG: hypothetical protein AAF458_05585 [Pseudomonadota bacterium]